MLPKRLRDLIWRTYRQGQEITKNPSREYTSAAREVQDWIRENLEEEMQRLFSQLTKRQLASKQKELQL